MLLYSFLELYVIRLTLIVLFLLVSLLIGSKPILGQPASCQALLEEYEDEIPTGDFKRSYRLDRLDRREVPSDSTEELQRFVDSVPFFQALQAELGHRGYLTLEEQSEYIGDLRPVRVAVEVDGLRFKYEGHKGFPPKERWEGVGFFNILIRDPDIEGHEEKSQVATDPPPQFKGVGRIRPCCDMLGDLSEVPGGIGNIDCGPITSGRCNVDAIGEDAKAEWIHELVSESVEDVADAIERELDILGTDYRRHLTFGYVDASPNSRSVAIRKALIKALEDHVPQYLNADILIEDSEDIVIENGEILGINEAVSNRSLINSRFFGVVPYYRIVDDNMDGNSRCVVVESVTKYPPDE